MSATRTPEQIARETLEAHAVPAEGRRRDEIQTLIANAIQADRAQWFDTAGSASSQGYIETGRHMLHEEVAEMEALNARPDDAAPAKPRLALVVLAKGQTWSDDTEVEVLDVDGILQMGQDSGWDAAEIAEITAKLRDHGWESIAEDVEEAWGLPPECDYCDNPSTGQNGEGDNVCDEHADVPKDEQCDECAEAATNHWPNLTEPIQLCDGHYHNARRSGWEPGQ